MLREEGLPLATFFDSPVTVRAGLRQVAARAARISTRGMLLYPCAALQVGERVSLRFPLLGSEASLQGRVVSEVRELSYACTIEFTAMPHEVGAAIRSLSGGPQRAGAPARGTRPTRESPAVLSLYQQALQQLDKDEREQRRSRRQAGS